MLQFQQQFYLKQSQACGISQKLGGEKGAERLNRPRPGPTFEPQTGAVSWLLGCAR